MWHSQLYLKSLFQSCRQAGVLQGTFPESFTFILHNHLVENKVQRKSLEKKAKLGRVNSFSLSSRPFWLIPLISTDSRVPIGATGQH